MAFIDNKIMNKKEAIQKMVAELSSVSQDQFRTLMEASGEYHNLPMWGTMWRLDYFGEDIYESARVMVGDKEEIDLDAIDDEKEREEVKEAIKALDEERISWGECALLENYIDEEMAGERCVLDKNGNTTAMFVYELDGEYWLGVNGAGWDFYDGVWDKLYDIMGLKWHNQD